VQADQDIPKSIHDDRTQNSSMYQFKTPDQGEDKSDFKQSTSKQLQITEFDTNMDKCEKQLE
jgi:hypothetical protein